MLGENLQTSFFKTQTQPLVSIIIPAFNAENHIVGAINTAFLQTHQNLEVIVVNDGSTDRTRELVEQIISRDARVKLINQSNKGVSVARNNAILAAEGSFLAFLDCDDVWDAHKIETQLRKINDASSQNSISITGFRFCLPSGDKHPVVYPNRELGFQDVIQNGFMVMPSSWLVARQLFNKVGLFDETIHCGEDADWLIKAIKKGAKLVIEPQALTDYRVSDPSKRYKNQAAGIKELLQRHSEWLLANFPSEATKDLMAVFLKISEQDINISMAMREFSRKHQFTLDAAPEVTRQP